MAHPGIEHSLGEIHEQVDNEVNHRGEQCDGLYGSVVSCVNRFCDIATDSRPAKDCLGNDSSAEKLSELKPHNCCDGMYGSVVSCVNRFCDIATDSRPAKDCLGNDSSAEKLSELKPHNCCDGRCRIFQSVYAHDGCW